MEKRKLLECNGKTRSMDRCRDRSGLLWCLPKPRTRGELPQGLVRDVFGPQPPLVLVNKSCPPADNGPSSPLGGPDGDLR
jgi:hypothetical protein